MTLAALMPSGSLSRVLENVHSTIHNVFSFDELVQKFKQSQLKVVEPERVGFVPKERSRASFRVASDLNLNLDNHESEARPECESRIQRQRS